MKRAVLACLLALCAGAACADDALRQPSFAELAAEPDLLNRPTVEAPAGAEDGTEEPGFVTVVPEPHIFTLLLGGFGALAFMVSRRKG